MRQHFGSIPSRDFCRFASGRSPDRTEPNRCSAFRFRALLMSPSIRRPESRSLLNPRTITYAMRDTQVRTHWSRHGSDSHDASAGRENQNPAKLRRRTHGDEVPQTIDARRADDGAPSVTARSQQRAIGDPRRQGNPCPSHPAIKRQQERSNGPSTRRHHRSRKTRRKAHPAAKLVCTRRRT